MGKIHTGIVEFFYNNKDRRYGFVGIKGGRGGIFFHFHSGKETERVKGKLKFIPISKPDRDPKTGDIIVFEIREGWKGTIKATPWGFLPIPQTTRQMMDVCNLAKPGDKLRIIFADKNFGGFISEKLQAILDITRNASFTMDDANTAYLQSVIDCRYWHGFRMCEIVTGNNFDAKCFIDYTINRGVVECIKKVV
ncbi:MAG: hypothetical protein NT094_05795 [Candidatus Staskawiczbacteria bacterium]|nr:hypothetical protein [Candidatus Staskawiczbacteria bacterium]